MKNQKGMGHLMLILCVIIIILIAVGAIYYFFMQLEKQIIETYETDMLLIQGKVKVLSEEAVINKQEELLKGRKVSDSLEDEEVKALLENGVFSQEEEKFSKYYILEKANLDEMGLGAIRLEKGYYIVNYDTDEVIYSKGIKVGENTYYKLSEIEELKQREENKANEEAQEKEQISEEEHSNEENN